MGLMEIRPAVFADCVRMQQIERAAGEMFRDVGMPEIADDAPPSMEELERYVRTGSAWVAASGSGPLEAYLLADRIDDALHIEQVSVDPAYGRLGRGRALIEHAAGQAAELSCSALTLTTFIDVPWNAPYYRRLGFAEIPDVGLTPGLAAVRRREAQIGLDRWPRTAMQRDLVSSEQNREEPVT